MAENEIIGAVKGHATKFQDISELIISSEAIQIALIVLVIGIIGIVCSDTYKTISKCSDY